MRIVYPPPRQVTKCGIRTLHSPTSTGITVAVGAIQRIIGNIWCSIGRISWIDFFQRHNSGPHIFLRQRFPIGGGIAVVSGQRAWIWARFGEDRRGWLRPAQYIAVKAGQHGGHFRPGDGAQRIDGGGRRAFHDPHGPGPAQYGRFRLAVQGAKARHGKAVPRHVGERGLCDDGRIVVGLPQRLGEVIEHDAELGPPDIFIWVEQGSGQIHTGKDTILIRPDHARHIPGSDCHIHIGSRTAYCGAPGVPVQHRGQHGPAHFGGRAKGIGAGAVEQPPLCHILDIPRRPVAGGHVPVGRERRGSQGYGQHGAQQNAHHPFPHGVTLLFHFFLIRA